MKLKPQNRVSTGLSSNPQQLKIGEISHKSGVSVKTIRYYEDIGLIRSSSRTEGGFRLFSLDVLPRLNFIKQTQTLGFSLEEIKTILSIHDQGKLPCDAVRVQIQQKIEHINQQISQLQLLKNQLLSLTQVSTHPTQSQDGIICPILQALE